MTDRESATRWKDTDGEPDADHPAGDIRLKDRWYGVRAAVLGGLTVAAALTLTTTTIGTTTTTTGFGTTTTGP